MAAIFLQSAAGLRPEMSYDEILGLLDAGSREGFEFPEPTIFLVPIDGFTTPIEPKNVKKLPRGMKRPVFATAFEVCVAEHDGLRGFPTVEGASLEVATSYLANLDSVAKVAAGRNEMLLAFVSLPLEGSMRAVRLITKEAERLPGGFTGRSLGGFGDGLRDGHGDGRGDGLGAGRADGPRQLPVIWNAQLSPTRLRDDSFVTHVDCYFLGRRVLQLVRATGEYFTWKLP